MLVEAYVEIHLVDGSIVELNSEYSTDIIPQIGDRYCFTSEIGDVEVCVAHVLYTGLKPDKAVVEFDDLKVNFDKYSKPFLQLLLPLVRAGFYLEENGLDGE